MVARQEEIWQIDRRFVVSANIIRGRTQPSPSLEDKISKVKTQFFVISCSCDGTVNQRFLYVHGEQGHRSLPTTKVEAKERLLKCRAEMKCVSCDAEIHQCLIRREKRTLKQKTSVGERKEVSPGG